MGAIIMLFISCTRPFTADVIRIFVNSLAALNFDLLVVPKKAEGVRNLFGCLVVICI